MKHTIWNQEKEREQVLLRARAVWKLTFKHQTTPSVWFFLVQVCTSFQPPKNPPSEPEKSILRTWTFSLLWSSTQRLQRVFLYLYTVCCRVVRPNKEGAFTPRKIIMSRKLILAMVMIYLRMSFATASSYTMYFPHITRKSPFLQAWQDTTSIMYLLSIPKTFARGVKFDFRHCVCVYDVVIQLSRINGSIVHEQFSYVFCLKARIFLRKKNWANLLMLI